MSKVIERLKKEENVVILPHINPDGDTLGSAISLKLFLKEMNINGYIVLNDDVPVIYNFMIEDQILSTKEFLKLDLNYNLVVSLDSSDLSRISDRKKIFKDKEIVNIDHHKTNTKYGDYNLVKSSSSTGEILYNLFTQSGIQISRKNAEALFVAISTDTGSFKYSNTTSKTFSVASKLREIGFDFEKVNTNLYQNESLTKIKLHNKVLSTLKIYNGFIGIVYLDDEIKNEFKKDEINTDGIVEYVRNIAEIQVAIFIKKLENDDLKVSLRSKGDFDVSKLAIKYNGGGHKKAAGFSYNGSIEECIKELLDIIS